MSNLSVITGAAGYVGYGLVQELLSRGERLRLLLLEPWPPFDNLPCEIVYGDITKPETIAHTFEGAHTVYHLAGLVEIRKGREDLVWRVNVDGTHNVIAACKKSGVRRLVYCSSVDAIAPAPHGTVMREPASFGVAGLSGTYGKTKAVATQSALNSACEGFEVTACMPSAVIGPYDYNAAAIGVMVRTCMRIRMPAGLRGGGYNFVDVRDVAFGLAQAASAPSGESYLLTGEYLDVSDFIALLTELTGREPPGLSVPIKAAAAAAPAAEAFYKLSGKTPLVTRYSLRKITENGLFSYDKATRDLGYNPRSTRESLADMIAWVKENE